MSGNPYHRISAGDGIGAFSATAWNDLMLLLSWWRSRPSSSGPRLGAAPNPGVVTVQNNGADCPWFGVLGLDNVTPPIDPGQSLQGFQQTPILAGNMPDTTKHRLRFGVALEPIPSGKYGRVAVAGVVQAQVYLDSNYTGVLAADIRSGDNAQLAITPGGFQVLYLQSGSAGSTVWAFVDLGNREAPLYAQQKTGNGGHPNGTVANYTIIAPANPGPGPNVTGSPPAPQWNGNEPTVPVTNYGATVAGGATAPIAIIEGFYGQYQLVSTNYCPT